jgi:hypothetical protein
LMIQHRHIQSPRQVVHQFFIVCIREIKLEQGKEFYP